MYINIFYTICPNLKKNLSIIDSECNGCKLDVKNTLFIRNIHTLATMWEYSLKTI